MAVASKIVFVNRYFYPDESATSRVLTDLAFRLAGLGIAVSVVTSRQLYDQPRAALPAHELVSGVEVHRVPTTSLGRAGLAARALDYATFHLAAAAQLFALLRRGDIVIAKTDPPLISIAASYVAALRGAKLINWLQDLFPEIAVALGVRAFPGWVESLLRSARDRSLRRATTNVVLGDRMRDHLLALGLEPSRIRTLPNWADVEQVTPRAVEHSLTRRRLRLQGHFVIGYSGNLGRAHEFATLLGAARALRADRRFVFLITGGGAKLPALQRAVARERLENFCFQPYQPPELLADSLAAADVHLVSLLPELEGLIVPSKLYGILAAARPAVFIGDADGEVAKVLRNHGCGARVPVGDGSGLAAKLIELAEAPALCARMGDRGRQLVTTQYSAERALGRWVKLLREVAPDVVAPGGTARANEEGAPAG